MKKLIIVFLIITVQFNAKATVLPINYDSAINVTCNAGDTLRFYTINGTSWLYFIYINNIEIASNITPGVGGFIYDYVAQIGDTAYALTNSNGEFLTRTMVVNGVSNVNNFNDTYSISVFPNPFVEKINLSFPSNDNLEAVAIIYNTFGQAVYKETLNTNHATIDLSELVKGTYFIEVKTKHTATVKKIIKE